MSGDIYSNLNSLILRSKSGSTTGQQNNTIIDGSINNITVARYGNVSQGAFSPYGNAGGSMYFDGSGDYLTTTSNVATALSNTDFTIEGWIYISAYPQANPNPISNWTGTWTGDCWSLHARHTSAGTDKFSFWVNNISSGSAILISTTTTRANRWFHVAITRSGSTMKMFVDGIQEATYNCGTTSVDNGTSKFINLGGYNSYNDAQFNGYLSDVRIIKGKALYTSDFALPTTPLTAVTNTQLLLSGTNASIKDYTGKIVTETVGNVQVSTVTKKFTEGAMYFDGVGDYLTVPNNQLNLSSGDFTIEGWIYTTTLSNDAASCREVIQLTPNSNSSSYSGPRVAMSGGILKFWLSTTGSTWIDGLGHGTIALKTNEWTHFAFTRNGSMFSLFVNGVLSSSYSTSATLYAGTADTRIGNLLYSSAGCWQGYIDDLRVTKGIARYVSDFAVDTQVPTDPYANQSISLTSPANEDPYWGSVVLSMHMEGANGGTTFVDDLGHSVTVGTGTALTTTEKKFGTSSVVFNGSNNFYVLDSNNDFAYGTGDFTIEFWINPTNLNATSGNYLWGTSSADGNKRFTIPTNGTLLISHLGNTTGNVVLNSWNHIAMSRSSGVTKIFLNGTQVLSASDTGNYTSSAQYFGSAYDNASTNRWSGYIDEIRFTKGVSRYNANFSVPTSAFPNVPTQKVVKDNSSNNFPVTRYGNTTQGTFSPFSNSGFSGYFANSTSDCVTYPSNIAFTLDTGDFTVEFWVFLNETTANQRFFLLGQSGTDGVMIGIPSTSGTLQAGVMNTYLTNYTLPTDFHNKWHHITLTRQGTSLKLFVDGIVVSAGTNSSNVTQQACHVGGLTWATGYNTRGYLTNVRLVKGTALYTSNFIPPTSPLSQINGTSLLCLQNNNFKDISSNNFTASVTGTPSIQPFSRFESSTYSSTVHGGSMYFDGTGDYLEVQSSSVSFGSNDFTIECWAYAATSAGPYMYLFEQYSNNAAAGGIYVYRDQGTTYPNKFVTYSLGTNTIMLSEVTSINTWYHIAITRSGNTQYFFLNGVLQGSQPCSGNLLSGTFTVGTYHAYNYLWNGYVSDVRIVKGTALYTANFTPPTAPLTPVANTQLLLKGTNSAVYDNSGKVDLELLGTAKVSTTVKKYSSSIAFDGSAGCYAKISNSSLVGYGNGDFTIEFWLYKNTSSDMFFIDSRTGDPQSTVCLYYTAGTIRLYVSSADRITGGSITPGVWTHVALSRNSGITRLFLNGVQTGSNYVDTTNYISQTTLIGIRSVDLVSSPLNGYIEDLRITKGIGRYATGFTVPATTLGAVIKTLPITDYAPTVYEAPNGDPYYNNVVLHMHMDGTNGGTTFADQKGHALTVSGNAKLVTTEKKFGATSAYFDGAGDYLVVSSHADFTLGTGDFTIETWINVSVAATTTIFHPIFDGRAGVNGAYPYLLVMGAAPNTGKLAWYVNATAVISDTNVLPLNTWHHVAVSRSSGSTKLFLNGVQVGNTWIDSTNYLACTSGVSIGRNFDTSNVCTGYIDELRVTKGVARYTSNFDAPTAAFPDHQEFAADPYIGQSVLIKPKTAVTPNYTKFVDSSNNVAIAGFGDTIQTTKSPYTVGGGSAYFDGIGDYLTTDRITLAGDCTIELWFYQTASATSYVPIVNDTTDTYSFPIVIDYNGGSKSVGNVGFYTPNAATASTTNGTTFTKNTWTHIAFSRSGTNHRLFVNGVLVCSTTATAADIHINNIGRYNLSYEMIGYVSDVRVVGTALYTENFTPSTTPLTVIANTRLLASMDGTNTSSSVYHNNTIIDSSTNKFPITRVGNVAQGTFSPFSNGGWSGYFDGSGDYLTLAGGSALDLVSAGGTFTIEFWVNTPLTALSRTLIMGPNDNTASLCAEIQTNGSVNMGRAIAGTSVATASGAVKANKWTHIAFVSTSWTVSIYIGGVLSSTPTAISVPTSLLNRQLTIGSDSNGTYGNHNGYLSNLRIVKGTALYTSNFTPSTTPLTAIANTVLLTLQSNSFKDVSSSNLAVTSYGNAAVQAFSPFTPTTYSAATHRGSLYFDGSGDYVTTPSDAAFTFGTGDFTIEFWVYTMSTGIQKGFLQTSTTPGGLTTGYTTGIVIVPDVGLSNQSLTNGLTANICGTTLNSNSQPLTRNTWHHIALTRQAGNAKLFVNGVLHASAAVTTSIPATYLCVGGYYDGNYLYQGYMSDLRVIKGTALYTASFTPPTAPLTAVANTQLLLNGTNSAIIDTTGRLCVETVGTVKVDTVNKKFDKSFSFNGTTDYLKLSDGSIYTFGAGDFTVEMWVNFNTVTGSQTIIGKSDASASGFAPLVIQANTTSLVVYSTTASGSWNLANAVAIGTISAGVWYHIAVVRNGTNLVTYFNGVQVSTVAVAANSLYATNTPVVIGAANISGTMSQFFNGRIEDLRITKGIARYV